MLSRQIDTRHFRHIAVATLLIFLSLNGPAQQRSPDSHYKLLKGNNYVQSKNYYLLTLFDELKDVNTMLRTDPVLAKIAQVKGDSLQLAAKACGKDVACFINRLKFSGSEIAAIGSRLKQLYAPGNSLDKLISTHLIPSGTYILYQDLPAAEVLTKAWEQEAGAVNWAIDVYAGGKKPNYPMIDSISLSITRPGYAGLLYNAAAVIGDENQEKPLFYSVSMHAALLFLEMNERTQVADFEPMEKGENSKAYDRIRTTKWSDFKYTVILIPGAGPDEPGVALSAEGMLRCRLGALQYRMGLAPFIIPSGGKVHPYKTIYNEAIEMKKYLVDQLGVPEYAIIIEPHARHTTTNMRNAARLMYRYGVPFNRPGVVCTTRGQSTMIGSTLIERSQKELNEVPYKYGERLGETLIEFYPLVAALQLDADEPMDP